MSLNLLNFGQRGQVAVLNQWADQVDAALRTNKGVVNGVQVAVNQLQNAPPPVIPTFTPNVIQLIDNFAFGTGSNSAAVGDLKWNFAGSTSTLGNTSTGAFPFLGTFNFPNDASASDYSYVVYPAIEEGGGATDALWPAFDYPFWTMVMRFRVTRYTDAATATPFPLTQTSMYLGLVAPSTSSDSIIRRPAAGAWLRFDTDTTAPSIADSTFHFECVANDITSGTVTNTQGNVFNTTIVPSEFTWYTLTISCSAAGVLKFGLVGTNGSSASTTLNMPTFTVNSGGFGTAAVNNGLADVSYGGLLHPFGIGSSVAFAGMTGGVAVLNGTHVLQLASTNKSATFFSFPGSIGTVGSQAVTATGFPAVVPAFIMGNDTTAAPTQNKQMAIDYFSFIWNPTI